MKQIQQKIPVKATLSELQGWLQDWHISNDKVNLPVYQVVLEDGRNKLFWHFSYKPATISEISFILEHKETGFLSVTFQYFDDEDIKPYAETLLREFTKTWSTHIPPLGFHRIVSKPEVATLLEERWAESERAVKVDAYLSATVLMGSILEGVLIDLCNQYPLLAGNANSNAPEKHGKTPPFKDW